MKALPRFALALVPLAALVACTGSAEPPVYGAAPRLPEPPSIRCARCCSLAPSRCSSACC